MAKAPKKYQDAVGKEFYPNIYIWDSETTHTIVIPRRVYQDGRRWMFEVSESHRSGKKETKNVPASYFLEQHGERKLDEYSSYVGKHWMLGNEEYIVCKKYPENPHENSGWIEDIPDRPVFAVARRCNPHYGLMFCDEFVKEAKPAPGEPEQQCYKCDGMSPYITSDPDGYDSCPTCFLSGITDTCEECNELDDFESAAFVGDYILCRSCYNRKDEAEIAAMEAGDY